MAELSSVPRNPIALPCVGQELRDDARLLREVRLVDLGVVQAVATQQQNAFTAPSAGQAAALALASPAALLAAAVCFLHLLHANGIGKEIRITGEQKESRAEGEGNPYCGLMKSLSHLISDSMCHWVPNETSASSNTLC